MKFRYPHNKPFTFLFLEVQNEKTTLNQNTLNQNLESQSTRYDKIQHLETEENEGDDANCKKSENQAHNFCVQIVKKNDIGKLITNSSSACNMEQAIKSMSD